MVRLIYIQYVAERNQCWQHWVQLSSVLILFIVGSLRLSTPVFAGTVYYEKAPLTTSSSSSVKQYQVIKGPAGESDYLEAEQYRLKRDFKRAETYYVRAAEKGYGKAHFRLGQMYATGRGSVRSLVEAHMHYNLSSYLGINDGRSAMLILEEQMTEDQIEQAMRRAVRYRKQHNL